MKRHIAFVETSTTGAGEVSHRISHQKGYEVTLLTRKPRTYSEEILRHVDRVVPCETNDAHEVLKALEQLARASRLDGVTTTADMYVPQAAFAAERLGLPGMPYEAALCARNKYRMRERLQLACPEHNAAFARVTSVDEALREAERIGYPLISKPQDENDGLDVRLIHGPEELKAHLSSRPERATNTAGQPKAPGVLLEEYLVGAEFSVETLQSKGQPRQVMGVVGKVLTGLERGCFVECGDRFPYLGPETEPLVRAVHRILDGLGVDCGVVHTECRIQDGRVKVMEVNPRLAGEKLGSHLIELASGQSAVEALVEIALGENVRWAPPRAAGAAMYNPFADRVGTFTGLRNRDEVLKMPGVVGVWVRIEPGTRVQPPESNGDLLADVIATGRDCDEAYARAREAGLRAHFEIQE
jgi:cysteine synthase A